MKLAKWGNSLAIRIPSDVVEELGLSPNDEAQIRVTGRHSFEVVRSRSRQEAIEAIRKLARPLPPDYKFNREDANDRELARQFERELSTQRDAQ
jgi:antitoxin MazE